MADAADASRRGRRPRTASRTPTRASTRPFGPVARLHLFVGAEPTPRTRRATDVLVLVACGIAVAAIGLVAQPPAAIESALIRFLAAFPGFLYGMWRLGWTLVAAWAVLLIVLAAVRLRFALARDLVLAFIGAGAVTLVVGEAVGARGDSLWEMWRSTGPPAYLPPLRLALAVAVIVTMRPYVTRPFRRVGRWIIVLGAVASVMLAATTPSGMILGLLVGTGTAAAVHLGFGSAAGRASLAQVRVALAQLGVGAARLEAAGRQSSGVFNVRGFDDDGNELVVKVYGRDAYDTQVVAKIWRALWYRTPDAAFTLTRLQQVEHEAFLLLHAAQQGVRVPRVVTAGTTPDNDALLVLLAEGTPLRDLSGDRLTNDLLHRAWQSIASLHDAGIVHGQIDDEQLAATDGGDIVLADLGSARVVASEEARRSDLAQLFVTTLVASDEARAVEVARAEIGDENLALALPYVQVAALGTELRRAVKERGLDVDATRSSVATTLGAELAEPVRLRRVTRGGLLRALLLSLAAYAILSALGGLDLQELANELRNAAWGWLVVGFVLGQTPRLTQAASTRAASPKPIPFGPLAMLQLAISFVNLAVPSTVGRVAVSVRFFQRQGLRAATAMSIGALDSFAGFIVQVMVLSLAFFTGFGQLDLQLNRPADSGGHRIIVLLVVVAVAAVLVIACTPRWRRACINAARDAIAQVRETLASLTLTRVMRLLMANAATELLFAMTLGVFVEAYGTTVPLATLLVVNVSAALLAGLMPVPGGIGVSEGALIAGLVAAGVNETVAFAAVISYRLATFYLPPLWGALAFRWLERNRYL